MHVFGSLAQSKPSYLSIQRPLLKPSPHFGRWWFFFIFYLAVSLPFYHSQEPRTDISGRLSKASELPSVSSLSPEYVQNIALCTSPAAGSPWMFDVSLLSGLSFDSTFLFPLSFLCLLPLLFLSCIFCQLAYSPDYFGQENSTELFGKR